jgi:hypothetical protein
MTTGPQKKSPFMSPNSRCAQPGLAFSAFWQVSQP